MTDTQHDSHVKDYYEYHNEQTTFFDDLAAANKPADISIEEYRIVAQDAGLDEYHALAWAESMHEMTGTWNADVWSEKGWW